MSFTSVLNTQANATHDVLDVRNRLKVRWVDARPIATQVIECQAFRDGAYEKFIGDPVSGKPAVVTGGELAVSLVALGPLPRPTFVLGTAHDSLPESIL
jgi:hypothetical protein